MEKEKKKKCKQSMLEKLFNINSIEVVYKIYKCTPPRTHARICMHAHARTCMRSHSHTNAYLHVNINIMYVRFCGYAHTYTYGTYMLYFVVLCAEVCVCEC